eukprot:c10393_g1_i2.p1 GENE.c10393_g1_i2~~c10393_g1_i2.p1  ORF type:complete len:107 (-),score=13.22 c10393_g1_i2:30-350(-)
MEVLRAIGFTLYVVHPYPYLATMGKKLGSEFNIPREELTDLINKSLGFVNDRFCSHTFSSSLFRRPSFNPPSPAPPSLLPSRSRLLQWKNANCGVHLLSSAHIAYW